jgi:subtilisin family serine protease
VRRGARLAIALGVALAVLAAATPAAAIDPNDPTWYAAWGQRMLNMPLAWDITTGSPNVIIATVDTGVDTTIPDLQGALVPGWDFTTNSPGMWDDSGHGTAVATEIAARGNNGIGITGYCWGCRIMPVKVAAIGSASDATIAAGIRWAVDHGARIVNVSLNNEGVGGYDPTLASAVAYAKARGVLLFASAGNTGNTNVTYPAGYPGAYAVAAVDGGGNLYSWSAQGDWIPFAAPGCEVALWPPNGSEVCGTSATAPVLSGLAGLLLSAKPNLNADQVIAALQASMTPVAGIAGGYPDAVKAFQAIGLNPPPPPPPSPAPTDASDASSVVLFSGTLKRRRSVSLKLDAGMVWITLQTSKARNCSLTLRSSSTGIELATRVSPTRIRLVDAVDRGTYTLRVSCAPSRPKPYQLVVIGSLAQ